MNNILNLFSKISNFRLDRESSDFEMQRSVKFINFICFVSIPVFFTFIILLYSLEFQFERYAMLIYWTLSFVVLFFLKGSKLKLNFFYWQTLLVNPLLVLSNFYYQANISHTASMDLFVTSLLGLIVNFGLHFLGNYSNNFVKYIFAISTNIVVLTCLNWFAISVEMKTLQAAPNSSPVELMIKSNLSYLLILSVLTIFRFINSRYLTELTNSKKALENTSNELSLRQSIIIEQSSKLESANVELNHLIEDLNTANKKLEEVIVSKDKFISVISHDLKNQLSGVQLAIQLILTYYDSISDQDIFAKIKKINSEVEITTELLEDLLQWSRSLMGKIDFRPALLPYLTIIEKSMLMVSEKMKIKSLTFETDFKHTDTIFADEQLIFSIIRNLLSNAIKFSNIGEKIVINTFEKDYDLILSITNYGVGISEEKAKKLFYTDQRFSTLGTNSEKGTGLGLMLCKAFTDRNSGKIWFESDGTSYTTFFVSFPKAL